MNDSARSGLRFIWEWQAAPTVRAPELSATWSQLSIVVDGVIATLVEPRESSHGVRKSLDVPAYPLAEWLALNWWKLNSAAHRPSEAGVNLSGAADGFAWPDINLRSDLGMVWVEVRRRDRHPDHVRFLAEGRAILDGEEVSAEIGRFIDATVRRLEEEGVTGTLLQDEWAAIQSAGADEVEFCTVAAAWGLDPYNVAPNDADALINAAKILDNSALLAQLAAAVELSDLPAAEPWFIDAAKRIRLGSRLPVHREVGIARPRYSRPWLEGYDRALAVRQGLGLDSTELIQVEDLVHISDANGDAPSRVVGLVSIEGDAAGVVLPHLGTEYRRFAAARALGRMMTSPSTGLSVMTRSGRYLEKVERAFAAEFLAPASGIREVAQGDYSEDAIMQLAQRFKVSQSVIEHQIENQILAA